LSEPIKIFERKGYPTIKLFDDNFQIKGKDNLSFRSFSFDDVDKVRYYDPNNNWWTKILMTLTKFNNPIYWRDDKYRYLKIYKKNGATWNYPMPYKIDLELIDILKLIEKTANRNLIEITR